MMKIKVTQKHIDKGQRKNPCNCPIALALQEAFGTSFITVFPSISSHNKHKKYNEGTIGIKDKVIKLPCIADTFANNFDEGLRVDPFEFEIDYED